MEAGGRGAMARIWNVPKGSCVKDLAPSVTLLEQLEPLQVRPSGRSSGH